MQGIKLTNLRTPRQLRRLTIPQLRLLLQHFHIVPGQWAKKAPYIDALWPALQRRLQRDIPRPSSLDPHLPTLPSPEPSPSEQKGLEFAQQLSTMHTTMKQDRKQVNNPRQRRLRAQPGPPRGQSMRIGRELKKGAQAPPPQK